MDYIGSSRNGLTPPQLYVGGEEGLIIPGGGGFEFLNENTRLWYKSTDVTLPGGGVVNPWQDLSTFGKNLTNGTGSQRPAYVASDEGTPSVAFDGSNDRLSNAIGAGHVFQVGNRKATIAYVGRLNVTANVWLWALSDPPFTNNRCSLRCNEGNIQLELRGQSGGENIDIHAADGETHIYVMQIERTGSGITGTGAANGYQHTVSIWLDGVKVVDAYQTTLITADISPITFTVGAIQTSSTGGFSNSSSKEFVFWDTLFSGGVVTTINNILMNEYMT